MGNSAERAPSIECDTRAALTSHKFGGAWTELKLDAVEYYLQCYANALSHLFDLWYIDAFAGTGSRTEEVETGGLWEGVPIEVREETFAGSARRALSIRPLLHHFVFIEKNRQRVRALQALKDEYPDRDIRCLSGDANAELRALISGPPWTQGTAGNARGVVFLDPYALHVEWQTLVALARTRVLDVWYLFPIRDVTRQLALRATGIGSKEKRLNLVLGDSWRDDLYSSPPPSRKDQGHFEFAAPDEADERTANMEQIESWFRDRLQAQFGYVSEPLPILTTAGVRHFRSSWRSQASRSRPSDSLSNLQLTSCVTTDVRHLVICRALVRSARLFLVFSSPLFEKEGRPSLSTEAFDLLHPFRFHEPSARPGFAADNCPSDSR